MSLIKYLAPACLLSMLWGHLAMAANDQYLKSKHGHSKRPTRSSSSSSESDELMAFAKEQQRASRYESAVHDGWQRGFSQSVENAYGHRGDHDATDVVHGSEEEEEEYASGIGEEDERAERRRSGASQSQRSTYLDYTDNEDNDEAGEMIGGRFRQHGTSKFTSTGRPHVLVDTNEVDVPASTYFHNQKPHIRFDARKKSKIACKHCMKSTCRSGNACGVCSRDSRHKKLTTLEGTHRFNSATLGAWCPATTQQFINQAYKSRSNVLTRHLKITEDGDWTTFEYDQRGLEARDSYEFNLEEPALLDITGFRSTKDAFDLYDDNSGRRLIKTEITSTEKGKSATHSPDKAFESRRFSSGRIVLLPGFHHMRIVPKRSSTAISSQKHVYHKKNQGAIRLIPLVQCEYTYGAIFMVMSPVPPSQREIACNAFNGSPINLSNANYYDAMYVAQACLRDGNKFFIGAHNGNYYDKIPLYVELGNRPGHGSVFGKQVTGMGKLRPVMCTYGG